LTSAIGLLDITGIHFIITHVYYLGYRVLGARLKALGNYLCVGLFVSMRRFFSLSEDMVRIFVALHAYVQELQPFITQKDVKV
jgi:hypothetical protein